LHPIIELQLNYAFCNYVILQVANYEIKLSNDKNKNNIDNTKKYNNQNTNSNININDKLIQIKI
jgi:hypothetical protein